MARALKTQIPEPIVMREDGLMPRYQEDDIEFICRHLPVHEPTSVAGFMTKMGIETRSMSGSGGSADYHRLNAAFRRGLASGRLVKSMGTKSWRVAVKAAARAS